MTEPQLDPDTPPQRKRIAVACGRCRKRKIRCSGDPGHGLPCSNCKNAGADPCLFLRVSSQEAPLRNEQSYMYNLDDARTYASRASTASTASLQYAQEMPGLGSSDVLSPYRGGSTYSYTPAPASKPYYPAMSSYGSPYAAEFDYGLDCAPQPVMSHDQVHMLTGGWSRGKHSTYYVEPDSSCGYAANTTTLVHRAATHPISAADSPNFSFSSVAASLPSSTPSSMSDRLLPNPAVRSSAMPYPGSVKTTVTSTATSAPTVSSLADVATAAVATYASSGFDASGLAYASHAGPTLSGHNSGSHHSSHHQHTPSSSRANSDTPSYTTAGSAESIFGEHERSLQSQGPAFELGDTYRYTMAAPRRESVGSSGGHTTGATLSNGQAYVPSESAHEAAHHQPPQSHHHSHVSVTAAGYVSEPSSAATSGVTLPHHSTSSHAALSHGQHHAGSAGSGSTSHADSHRVAVGSRR
ncbi:hypothetical protein QBC46DRAFT_426581 [Diplogelasinospora grovesii]|uniref:Zn(2)-C6 fungal-type domain-containing protein n=1 Tax=Diplogelasinospora grovesii TaxID=303347 RepID=A0AAN6MX68_9PEZI|nr:hypothetical protein QBC46DRAFT_426581 [Diplogelasinospora grovesii]